MEKMYDSDIKEEAAQIMCEKCKIALETAPVKLEYLGNGFPVELPVCPSCHNVYIPEELALGKMLHVEQSLEDK